MYPPVLKPGDKIAILSPASIVNPDYIDGAADFFRQQGFEPVIMPHAKGPAHGSYAADDSSRLADLEEAYRDSAIKAILCARGGYGCNHLINRLSPALIAENPKWLIGFSDVSALHALILHAPRMASKSLPTYQNSSVITKNSIVSLHAPMAKHLASLPADHYCTHALMDILTHGLPKKYVVKRHRLNRNGEAEGILVGGNLAVINGLADTPFDPLAYPGPKILFIEDISEQIYAVERMLIRICLSGRLKEITGFVCGHFTEYRPDRNYPDMESMIAGTLSSYGYNGPLALGFPAGHTDDNMPLPLGCQTSLKVTDDSTVLSFHSQ